MCGLVGAVLGAGLSIMGSIAEYSAQTAAADAQNEYYMQNARAAQQAAANQYMWQQKRIAQERERTDQEMFENSVKAMEKRGSAYASAGEAGVSGLSVDALIGNIYAQEGRQQMAELTQYEINRDQIRAEMDQTQAQAQRQINSVQRASYPSFGSFLIKGMAGALGGFRGLTV